MKTELRVGNYVSLHGIPYKVDEIFDNGVRLINGDNNYVPEYQYIKPVPLTPEILVEKAGFVMKVSKDGLSYELGIFKLFTFNDKWYVSVIEGYSFETCQYLHQLQNLYYCLTQNELQITL